jgi:hypothetical protein
MHPSKRLKSAEPDLEVVVGEEGKIYNYHSVVLASWSDYVDTMLATPMKEQQTKRITFPEIEPKVWEQLIDYIHTDFEDITSTEAKQLLPLYDKYGFQDAMLSLDEELAKQVSEKDLVRILTSVEPRFIWLSDHPVAWLISYISLCEKYSLADTEDECVNSLRKLLEHERGRIKIYVSHWMQLAKFVTKNESLWEPVGEVLGEVGEANKEKFVHEDSDLTIYKLLRALFEKAYAQSKGVVFP